MDSKSKTAPKPILLPRLLLLSIPIPLSPSSMKFHPRLLNRPWEANAIGEKTPCIVDKAWIKHDHSQSALHDSSGNTLLKKQTSPRNPFTMSALSTSPGRKQIGIIQAPKVSVYARPKQPLLITEPMSILRNRVVHCLQISSPWSNSMMLSKLWYGGMDEKMRQRGKTRKQTSSHEGLTVGNKQTLGDVKTARSIQLGEMSSIHALCAFPFTLRTLREYFEILVLHSCFATLK